jgi:Fic family protein
MPIDQFGRNLDYVEYFPLEEYIDKIDLLDDLLNHLEETSKEFDEYISLLSEFANEAIINYWINSAQQEYRANQDIERTRFNAELLKEKGIFFDKLSISHKRIHDLHDFVMLSSDDSYISTQSYRKVPVNISRYTDRGEEIFWRGANPEDVDKFMNDFINVYKQNKMALIYSNPFLRAAITSLLFNRIHPYTDGNGRTSRIIYNLKFTEQMNKIHQTNLMLNPLNISNRILANKITYVKTINQIAFNLKDDTNEAINNWFDFILTMVDEQLSYSKERLASLIESSPRINDSSNEEIMKRVRQMKMSKLK